MNDVDDFSFLGVAGASPDANYPPTHIRLDLIPSGARGATEAEVLEARQRARIREMREAKKAHWDASWSDDAMRMATAGIPSTGAETMRNDVIALESAWNDFIAAINAAANVLAVNAVTISWPPLVGSGA